MKTTFKKSLWFFFVGGLAGGLLASLASPKMIAWYFDPPVNVGISCKEPIQWALHRLQMSQLFGILTGGILAIVAGFSLLKKRSTATEPPFTE